MKTEQHNFVLKDGLIYHVTMPEKPWTTDTPFKGFPKWAPSHEEIDAYEDAVQSAIDNAVEVSNQSITISELEHKYNVLETGKLYSLQCSVEKKCCAKGFPFHCEKGSCIHQRVLVSFPPPVDEGEKHAGSEKELFPNLHAWLKDEASESPEHHNYLMELEDGLRKLSKKRGSLTLQQAKDRVAKSRGFHDWKNLTDEIHEEEGGAAMIDKYTDDAWVIHTELDELIDELERLKSVKEVSNEGEKQEELWKEVFHQSASRMDFMQFLQKNFTITRKK